MNKNRIAATYPRQPDGEGGWTIAFAYLKAINEKTNVHLEDIQVVLLAASAAGGVIRKRLQGTDT